MMIVKTRKALQQVLAVRPAYSPQTAFVPTMGALHEGHISLVKAAREKAETVVVSIFVNPTQFNDAADFQHYPVSLEQDIDMLTAAGANVLYLPGVADMYPDGTANLEQYPLGTLENLLEGFYRPGHFQGVCQVVRRLLEHVQPGLLYMGQKDYQQCMVVQHMIDDTQLPVHMQLVPTMREPSGLAMSSRNRRLSPAEQEAAVALYKALLHMAAHARTQPIVALEAAAAQSLLDAGVQKIDYITLANAQTLAPVSNPQTEPMIAIAAAFIGAVRLIDNLPVEA